MDRKPSFDIGSVKFNSKTFFNDDIHRAMFVFPDRGNPNPAHSGKPTPEIAISRKIISLRKK